MRHEKLFIKPDGTKVNIEASVYLDMGKACYKITLSTCEKGKRKFTFVSYSDDYSFRALSLPDREKFMYRKYLEIVTAEQIHEVKMELWEKLRPVPLTPTEGREGE